MVVEADGGLRLTSKADYRAPMVGNHGSPAFRGARDLAVEYSQARRVAWLVLSNICADRGPCFGISRKFGRQNGIWTVSSALK